jgi:hypothetical protein
LQGVSGGPHALTASTVAGDGSSHDLRGGAVPDLLFARLPGKKKDNIASFNPAEDTISTI